MIWEFVIYGRLGKGDIRSLNNQKFCDNRGWEIRLEILIDGRLVKVDRRSINNHQFRDKKVWEIRMGLCDRW